MALVSYSDSEDSDSEQQSKPVSQPAVKTSVSNFFVDKSNPGKIKINLQQTKTETTHEDEPAPKRPRVGGGAFSGFNAMLPAPKKTNVSAAPDTTTKAPARKVFSLKTGAEATFSRESDAELRNLFAEQDGTESRKDIPTVPSTIPKPAFANPAPPAASGTPFMFKPLSVSRNTKKKKPDGSVQKSQNASSSPASNVVSQDLSIKQIPSEPLLKKKISLFSSGVQETYVLPELQDADADAEPDHDGPPSPGVEHADTTQHAQQNNSAQANDQPQSLHSIASDLNLSAAQRRQLFGRGTTSKGNPASAINIVNFNTDQEYAHNQSLIAAGETVQHNPVRAIAPGKHSLRQLMNAASTQKEALEESFAEGRRNKKEAGNKYGW